MKILVCVKQVADSESSFEISSDKSRILFGPAAVWRLNRYDEYALEEAILISEKFSGTEIDAVTIGPSRCADALRRALSMGAGRAYHILYDYHDNIPPAVKAALLAEFAMSRGYDLILTGVMSEDSENCCTGPMTAALMGIPFGTHVVSVQPDPVSAAVSFESTVDSETVYQGVLKLPALLTLQSGINTPRYPSLSNVLRARSAEVPVIDPGNISEVKTPGIRQTFMRPDQKTGGVVHRGDPARLAEEALKFFSSRSLI